MLRLIVFILAATGVLSAATTDGFAEAFGKATRRHVEEVSADTKAHAGSCYRVLERLPACTSEEWTRLRNGLQPAAERVLRIEGFTETSGYTLDLDGTNSIVRVVALKPTTLESPHVEAKRIHLIATRTDAGEVILSYEVREQS